MPNKPEAISQYEARVFGGEYIAGQITQRRQAEQHQTHKNRIEDMDAIYRGDLSKYRQNGEPTPRDYLLTENKFKNALHDIARLAAEPREVPVFPQLGDSVAEYKAARVREGICDTIWEYGGGPLLKRKLYLDVAGTGMMGLAAFFNKSSEYTQFMRLDPRYCYPDVRNGMLQDMLYVESMKSATAKRQWEELEDRLTTKDNEDVMVATLYTDTKVQVAVVGSFKGKKEVSGYIVTEWKHNLGCVPVAWVGLDTFDQTFRGLFDQIGGSMALRNRTMGYISDYMEDMVHAPFEAKNVMNADDPPGPVTIYEHDPHAEESFIRRVAPASPAGTVFGVLQYMDQQEATEALQPPSRVGQVRQSIASGDFVNSTQGALSSAVREIQDCMAELRRQLHYIAFKIEEKFLDNEKPLCRAIGNKKTYTPSKDIKEAYSHRVLFGASAGLDRQYADVRVIQHVGAGLISKKTARSQLDYIDDPTSEQNWIDQEQIAAALLQRFASDPAAPISSLAESLVEMGKGRDLVEVMQAQAEKLLAAEQAAAAQAAGGGGMVSEGGGAPVDAEQEALALEKGATEGGATVAPIKPFSPPPLAQVFVDSG